MDSTKRAWSSCVMVKNKGFYRCPFLVFTWHHMVLTLSGQVHLFNCYWQQLTVFIQVDMVKIAWCSNCAWNGNKCKVLWMRDGCLRNQMQTAADEGEAECLLLSLWKHLSPKTERNNWKTLVRAQLHGATRQRTGGDLDTRGNKGRGDKDTIKIKQEVITHRYKAYIQLWGKKQDMGGF